MAGLRCWTVRREIGGLMWSERWALVGEGLYSDYRADWEENGQAVSVCRCMECDAMGPGLVHGVARQCRCGVFLVRWGNAMVALDLVERVEYGSP